MDTYQIIKKARQEFVKLGKTPANGITSFSRTEEGWLISLEALEKKSIPDTMDVLGLYEIHLDANGNLTGFDRKGLRKRGETKED